MENRIPIYSRKIALEKGVIFDISILDSDEKEETKEILICDGIC